MKKNEDYTVRPRSWQYRWEKSMIAGFREYAAPEGPASTWTQLHAEDIEWAIEQGAYLGGLFSGWEGREDGALILYCRKGAKVAADRLLMEAGLNSKEDPFYLVEEGRR